MQLCFPKCLCISSCSVHKVRLRSIERVAGLLENCIYKAHIIIKERRTLCSSSGSREIPQRPWKRELAQAVSHQVKGIEWWWYKLSRDRCNHSVHGSCLMCALSQHQLSGWCLIRHPNAAKQYENACPFSHSSNLLGKVHIPAGLTPVYHTSDSNTVPLLLHSLSVEALSLGPDGYYSSYV